MTMLPATHHGRADCGALPTRTQVLGLNGSFTHCRPLVGRSAPFPKHIPGHVSERPKNRHTLPKSHGGARKDLRNRRNR